MFWRNANLGIEYRFANQHSIGVDYVFFRWRYEQDSLIDGMDSGQGSSTFRRREYLLFDYRYYPWSNNKRKVDPYFNLLTKFGEQKIWTQDEETFHFSDDPNKSLLSQRSGFYEMGAAVEIRGDFIQSDRFGIDVNMGLTKRFNTVYCELGETYDPLLSYETNEHEKSQKWLIHMRLNLYVKLFKLK